MHARFGFSRPLCGLAMMLVLAAPAALAAPIIDCGNTLRSDEKTICADAALRDMDIALGVLETELENLVPKEDVIARKELRAGRTRFVRFRRLCSRDVACLKRAYEHRLQQLKEWKARLLKKK